MRGTIDQYVPQITGQGAWYARGGPTVDVGPVYFEFPDEILGRPVYRPTNTLVNTAQIPLLGLAGLAKGTVKGFLKTVGRETLEETGEETLQAGNEAIYRGGTFPGLGEVPIGGVAASTSYGGGFSESAVRGLSQASTIASYAIEFVPGGPQLTQSNAGRRSQIDQFLYPTEQGYSIGQSQINPQTLYSPFQDVQSRFQSLTPSRRDAALNTATQQLALRPPEGATPASSYRTAPSQLSLAPLGATSPALRAAPDLSLIHI